MDKQQAKARFFGAHIGCECVVYGAKIRLSQGRFEYCLIDYDSKLILRPMSSMTDDEVAHCEGIEKSMQQSKWGENAIGASIGDYIRSIGICIPFMGLDPITEGWAILEEKIPANRVIAISCTNKKCHSTGQVSSEDCEIPKSAVSAIETCPRHKKDGDIGSDLKFFDSDGNIVY